MTRWFCNQHRTAGAAIDAVCCDRAVLAVSAGDCVAWLRIRLSMRTREEAVAIYQLRVDNTAMRQALIRHAWRNNRRWYQSKGT